MQSTSIQDFPPNSKRRLELQNQHNLQYQQFQQQQQQQEEISDYNIQEPPFKKHRPGIAANFLYKFVELATYTSAFASDAINAINTITGNTSNTGGHSTRQNFGYDDDILQIDDDDENAYDHKKKDVSTWGENVETVEDEEPPPPYDNSWYMPSSTTFENSNTTTTETKPSLTISTSPSQQDYPTIQTSQKIVSTSTHSPTNSTSRRRQFRVRRGRRLIRRKSSSVDMSNSYNNTSTHSDNNVDDDEDIFLKFNCKLSDMIAEGTAALNSKVEVTEVEMILAEEKEREERIMKEFGIQTPISRRRTNFNVHNYNYTNYNNNYNFY